jgi:hypothetical protein
MYPIIFFIIGLITSMIIIRILFPKKKQLHVLPSPTNYKDITYLDDDGVLYQYDIVEEHNMNTKNKISDITL